MVCNVVVTALEKHEYKPTQMLFKAEVQQGMLKLFQCCIHAWSMGHSVSMLLSV